MILDARYERVRESGRAVDCAVLVAVGVTTSGHRRVLGVSVALSEAEVHWRAFLDSLIERGLRGVKFLASDDHAGLKAARKAMFPGVPWQRCQFHLQRNAQGYVSRLDQRTPVARQIRGIFNASDAIEAQRLLNAALKDLAAQPPTIGRLGREKPVGGLCRLRLARGPSGAHAHHQWLGAFEQGTQAPNPCSYFVSQLGQLPATAQCLAGRTR